MSQNWQKVFSRVNWINYPSTGTPLNQTNLNKGDSALDTIDTRVVTLDGIKLDETSASNFFKSVSYTASTGTFVFTKYDDSTVTIDTDIEKIAVNFDYDDDPTSPHYQNLVITLEDGTVKYVDLSALITQFEFIASSTISFTVAADGTVSADVRNGSIGFTQLDANVTTYIDGKEADAAADALVSEGWARGTQNGTPVTSGSPYYEDNSKYYSQLSDADRLAAEGHAVGQQNGVDVDSSSPYYHNNAKYYKDQAQAIAAQSLSALSDVAIENPENGQALIYEDGEWVNKEVANSYEDLTDTQIDNLQVLDKPIWNGSKWVNVQGGELGEMLNPWQDDSGNFLDDGTNPIMLRYDAMGATQLTEMNLELLMDSEKLLDLGENYCLCDENGVFIAFPD